MIWRKNRQPATGQPAPQVVSVTASQKPTWRTRAGWWLVVAVVFGVLACGPAALALNAASGQQQAKPPAQVLDPGERSLAESAARDLVAAWLSATSADSSALSAVYGGHLGVLPRTATTFADLQVECTRQINEHLWLVTIGVSIEPAASDDGAPAPTATADLGLPQQSAAADTDLSAEPTREYYQVPVETNADREASALTLPTPVAGPARIPASDSDYSDEVATTSVLGATVTGFLTVLTTGEGDLSRYVSPDSTVRAMDPAPYVSAEVREIRAQDAPDEGATTLTDGHAVRVLASVECTRADGSAVMAEYPLTVIARAGRWEVDHIDAHPLRTGPTPGKVDEGEVKP